jgi:hypothetical protein
VGGWEQREIWEGNPNHKWQTEFIGIYFNQYIVVFLFNTVIYVFLLLGLCILIVRLPWLRFFRAFSSVVRQMPGYNSPRQGTARTFPKRLCRSVYCLFVSFCVLFVSCIVLLPPGGNPIAVNKYIILYHISYQIMDRWGITCNFKSN